MRLTMSVSDRGVAAVGRQAAADDLDRAADAGQRILDLVRDDGGHLADPGECRALAQPLLERDAAGEVVQDAGELALAVDRHLADRQVQRKRGAIAPAARDFASGADDLGSPVVR